MATIPLSNILGGTQTLTLSGDISGSGVGNISTTIGDNVVSLPKLAVISTGSILGRSTSGNGNVETISVGSGLQLSGGVLSATAGGGGSVTSVNATTSSTGLTISGGPITGSGSLTFTLSTNLQSWSGITPSSKADSTHNHTLDSLSNTTITSNTNGEILRWNGTAWINNTLAEAGIQPAGSYAAATHTHAATDITSGTLNVARSWALTGDITSAAGSAATTIANGAVSLAKMANVVTNSLIGRSSAGTGAPETITVGSGLILSGGVLSATGGGGGGGGSVTNVSVVTANGISGSVANSTTTPAITLTLGAITPTSVSASGNVTGANLSGTNTGDQTNIAGNAGTATTLQTARTLTIGNTGKTFNGSANVAWSLAEIGAADTGHNHTLDSLSNTTITSNTNGEILRWNGTAWVNNTLVEAGIQPAGSYASSSHTHSEYAASTHNHTLDSLSNTTITSNTNGEILRWNGTAWINNTLAEAGIQPALGYTPYNSTNPNGYTSNTGTVTSVTGGNGLTGSVTTSGSIELGTPGTLTGATTNSVTSTSHTHALSTNLSAWDAIAPSAKADAAHSHAYLPLGGGTMQGDITFAAGVTVHCSNWYRSTGDTGWYSSTYGGGIYMTDTTYLRSYLGKAVYASDFVGTSDARLKKNIVPFEEDRRYVLSDNAVRYNWIKNDKPDIGFIAQTVMEVYPELVDEVPNGYDVDENGEDILLEGSHYVLNYPKCVAVLAGELRSARDEIDDLRAQIQNIYELLGDK